MCRLSIVVPYDRNEAAFEATLVSVLENRPEFCEVLVTHDGSYDDPFDLTDEVRFVVADGEDSLSHVRAGVGAALGRIVHVLERGSCASEGWTDQAIHLFEQADIGCVAPVIRDAHEPHKIIAAGWRDTNSVLHKPVGRGSAELARGEGRNADGAFVSGSFWRRSVLDSIVKLPTDGIAELSDYAWAYAARCGGWKCRIADESNVMQSATLSGAGVSDLQSVQVMQQIRCGVLGERPASFALRSLLHVALNPLASNRWKQAVGRITSAMGLSGNGLELVEAVVRIGKEVTTEKSNAKILKMPSVSPSLPSGRRAA